MLNQTILVGKIKKIDTKELENGGKKTTITLAVTRSWKNSNGEYDIDFIPCVLWNSIAENAIKDYECEDLVAVKGRLQTRNSESEKEEKRQIVEVVAEKVTFLSTEKKSEGGMICE